MKPEDNGADRREFLKMVGVAGAASALPFIDAASGAEMAQCPVMRRMTTGPNRRAHVLPAMAMNSLTPTNPPSSRRPSTRSFQAIGPGADELGVAIYIDRQMAGGYGKGDRLYLEGPFGEGTPEQGYQLPMTPSELIRAGIADVSAHAQEKHKSTFDALSAKDRAAVMADLDGKKVELPTCRPQPSSGCCFS